MKTKGLQTKSVTTKAIWAVAIMLLLSFSSVRAQDADGLDREKDILALPNPFSLPAMLRRMLDDMDKKVLEEIERNKKKAVVEAPSPVVAEPEAPPVVKPDVPSMTLSGIIFNDANSQAIINEDVFSAGDNIKFSAGDVHIDAIEKNRIIFTFLEDSYVLGVGDKKESPRRN